MRAIIKSTNKPNPFHSSEVYKQGQILAIFDYRAFGYQIFLKPNDIKMPPKKKGKGNKLARMTEEEKLRYLQHRAAIEEEARRRKEHVIASYMKNKLKHEEAFTRLNTAKINQQWRQTLRQIKNKELHDASETLRQVFEVALKTKNTIIKNLCDDLDDSSKQHALAVQTHLVAVDKILDIRCGRLDTLSTEFKATVDRNMLNARAHTMRLEDAYQNDDKVLKAIINCEKKCYDQNHDKLEDLAKKHTDNLLHQLMAETKQAEIEGHKKIDELKKIIKQTENKYFNKVKPVQDQYKELLTSDEKSLKCLMENERVIKDYNRIIEKMKSGNAQRIEEKREEIEGLRESLDKKKNIHNKLKKCIKQHSDESKKRLSHLSKVSNQALDELGKIVQTVEEIDHYMGAVNKLLSETEIVEFVGAKQEMEDEDVPLAEMSQFWQIYGKLQAEVADYELEYSNSLEEVATLKQLLKSSMNTIARPSTVPSSLYRDKMLMRSKSATRC